MNQQQVILQIKEILRINKTKPWFKDTSLLYLKGVDTGLTIALDLLYEDENGLETRCFCNDCQGLAPWEEGHCGEET